MPDWFIEFPSEINLNIKDAIDKFIRYLLTNGETFFEGIKGSSEGFLNGIQVYQQNSPVASYPDRFHSFHGEQAVNLERQSVLSIVILYWGYGTVAINEYYAHDCYCLCHNINNDWIPMGIWVSYSDRLDRMIRPVLDTMQTMPSLCILYLLQCFWDWVMYLLLLRRLLCVTTVDQTHESWYTSGRQ